jgi:hypothetical protein
MCLPHKHEALNTKPQYHRKRKNTIFRTYETRKKIEYMAVAIIEGKIDGNYQK